MAIDSHDFIRNRIREDLKDGTVSHGVVTRFPPEPNGFLHIGHAKSICLNFGVALEHGGRTYLRFDDTNPLTESAIYVESIQNDVRWLGFDWGDCLTFASDYFEQLCHFAEELITKGKAYVCDLTSDEIREARGTLTRLGTNSPYRTRAIDDNLERFHLMRSGQLADGTCVLRAKIDMSSPNINMRDPILYRILHATHHRTGDEWCIYPTYDFTHCICDALERITHSLCTLEFEDHRPLYDWVLNNISIDFHPPQIEFAGLKMEYHVMSKRIFTRLVDEEHVDGWDDCRLPTLAGLRRRGIPPAAIREFCQRIGVSKQDNLIETELLDFCVRSVLEATTRRCMAVLNPLRVTVANFEGEDEELDAPWHGNKAEMGSRKIKFGRRLYIERSDFTEDPPKRYHRLSPGAIVRLRYAYIIRCDDVVKNDKGDIEELLVTYFPDSKSGEDASGLKPKGVLHFVSATNALDAEFRTFEHLFTEKIPDTQDLQSQLNIESKKIFQGFVEGAMAECNDRNIQFERAGFFVADPDSTKQKLIFNRTVSLSSGWKNVPKHG